jgi:RNA polymerase sigma-70 factor, ECF subfamily
MDDTLEQSGDAADVALMQRLQSGDESAFDSLVDRWKNPLINFFYRSLHSYERAEDLSQLVFIRLYRAAPNWEPRARFSTWLFQIARHLLINEYRQNQRKPLSTFDPADWHDVAVDHGESRLNELEELFAHAVAKMPENQRTAILLLKQQELSYQQIAEVMDASEGAVKTWIFRARQFLKQELKDMV